MTVLHRQARFEEFIGAIASSILPGQPFSTYEAGEILQRMCGVRHPGTAVTYAGHALRYQMEVQDHVPEAMKLVRNGKRGPYYFIGAEEASMVQS